MKLYARIENEKGKVDGMGGNEYLNIDITVGSLIVAKIQISEKDGLPTMELKTDNSISNLYLEKL